MVKLDIQLTSKHNDRKFMADASFVKNGQPKPIVIFNHGFKGFKDWGPFGLIANKFAEAGFIFVKMNFSHNGISEDDPNEFNDLEAFAMNNFSKELDDTGVLIDHLSNDSAPIESTEMDLHKLFIVGHSRGGASAILKANEDSRIKAVTTWAAVNNLQTWHSREELDHWKKNGRIYILNSRTNQQMPLDFQLVENFIDNRERLQVPEAVKAMKIPMLAIHGSDDPTVPVQTVKEIGSWNSSVEIKIIPGAGHTFGGSHPFEYSALPPDLQKTVDYTINFFQQIK